MAEEEEPARRPELPPLQPWRPVDPDIYRGPREAGTAVAVAVWALAVLAAVDLLYLLTYELEGSHHHGHPGGRLVAASYGVWLLGAAAATGWDHPRVKWLLAVPCAVSTVALQVAGLYLQARA